MERNFLSLSVLGACTNRNLLKMDVFFSHGICILLKKFGRIFNPTPCTGPRLFVYGRHAYISVIRAYKQTSLPDFHENLIRQVVRLPSRDVILTNDEGKMGELHLCRCQYYCFYHYYYYYFCNPRVFGLCYRENRRVCRRAREVCRYTSRGRPP